MKFPNQKNDEAGFHIISNHHAKMPFSDILAVGFRYDKIFCFAVFLDLMITLTNKKLKNTLLVTDVFFS